jgi:uncharacterized protein YbjT (DUF2867 family)
MVVEAVNTSMVAGATGLVGRQVVEQLTAQRKPVIALTRRPVADFPNGTEQLLVDFNALLGGAELPACQHLYVCLGTTIRRAGSRAAFRKVDIDYAVVIAKRARASGATRLTLVSSVGANVRSANFYLRTKGEVEEALLGLGFASVDIFRPGLLTGARSRRRMLEGIAQNMAKVVDPILVGGLRRYRSVPADKLAAAMVEPEHQLQGTRYWHFADLAV